MSGPPQPSSRSSSSRSRCASRRSRAATASLRSASSLARAEEQLLGVAKLVEAGVDLREPDRVGSAARARARRPPLTCVELGDAAPSSSRARALERRRATASRRCPSARRRAPPRGPRARARALRASPPGAASRSASGRATAGAATPGSLPACDARDRRAQLVLALLDRRDALGQLALQVLERGALLGERHALLCDGSSLSASANEHDQMVRRTRGVPCRERACRSVPRSGGALEPLFGSRAAHDLARARRSGCGRARPGCSLQSVVERASSALICSTTAGSRPCESRVPELDPRSLSSSISAWIREMMSMTIATIALSQRIPVKRSRYGARTGNRDHDERPTANAIQVTTSRTRRHS